MSLPVEGRKDNRFRGVGKQNVGGDEEGAQLDALSHFEHKCEQRESARLNSGASLIQPEVIFLFFSFSLAGAF